jgi:hypothetical protein
MTTGDRLTISWTYEDFNSPALANFVLVPRELASLVAQ